jgi:hypothetical protein
MSKCEALSPLRMMALGRDPGQAMVPRKQRLLQSQTAGLVELFDACVENDVKKAAYYIKYGVDLEGMNQDEDRPMHVAVMNDNFHLVECLLLHGANVYGLDVLGRKPMHLACLRGNLRLVHLLFKHGNGITDHKLTDDELRQPLHYAAQANDNDICELLIDKGAEVEAIDSEGRAPLHFAALSPLGDWEVAACLVARGADVHFVDKQGIKALHLAATRIDANAFAFIEYLLSQGCDIDERTANGRTPLFFAAVSADVKMVKFLLEKGADINAKTHQRIPGTTTILHQTALHYAAIEGVVCLSILWSFFRGVTLFIYPPFFCRNASRHRSIFTGQRG